LRSLLANEITIAKAAYIDESLRIPQGLYLLAAVIIADADASD
jgi:hypothetical protein